MNLLHLDGMLNLKVHLWKKLLESYQKNTTTYEYFKEDIPCADEFYKVRIFIDAQGEYVCITVAKQHNELSEEQLNAIYWLFDIPQKTIPAPGAHVAFVQKHCSGKNWFCSAWCFAKKHHTRPSRIAELCELDTTLARNRRFLW
jgi:hypothetical protein